MVGCAITTVKTEYCLLIGRVLYGYASGVLSSATNRMVDEYVPLKLFSTLSPVFSFFLNIGTLLATFSASILPPDDSDKEVLADCQTWRYIFGFPILPYCLMLVLLFTAIDLDTPKFYLLMGDREMA